MTTTQRTTRSRTNRSMRFNKLVELTSALSEADKDTKDKLDAAEILSLLGVGAGSRSSTQQQNESPRGHTSAATAAQQPVVVVVRGPSPKKLPLPPIMPVVAAAPAPAAAHHHTAAPAATGPQLQAIRPATARPGAALQSAAAATGSAPAQASPAKVASVRPSAVVTPVEGEKKRKRSKTTPEQLRILMDEFNREPMPNATTRQTLAAQLDMTPRSVQIWFQNMRAKVKKAASSTAGSAPGDEKKSAAGSSSPSLTDSESDGPARKRPRVAGEEDSNKMAVVVEQPTPIRRNSLPPTQPAAASPAKIVGGPQSAFTTIAAAGPSTASSPIKVATEAPAGKLPLPVIHHGHHHHHQQQPIFGVPLQYIPQSYHCDQLKRALPAIAVISTSQMTA